MTSIARTFALIVGSVSLAAAAESAVDIQLFRFGPGRLEVKAGDRVTWASRDDITHTVTSGVPERPDGRFDQRLAGKGTTATVEFKDPGVYPYFCSRHPSMRGEVRVN